MNDDVSSGIPATLAAIERGSAELGFAMNCERKTGALLRSLVAGKPGARVLELGTGTGASTAWLLAGMDASARLLTVDNDAAVTRVAQHVLGDDTRLSFRIGDGAQLLAELVAEPQRFDLIFADAWPGKYSHLDEALTLLAPGGFYVIDDMLPQPTWPEAHEPRVRALLATLDARAELAVTKMHWASGLVIATRLVR